jgi:uncharacterized membrane protein
MSSAAILFGPALVVVLLSALLPGLTRTGATFGVAVPTHRQEAAGEAMRRYRSWLAGIGLVLLIGAVVAVVGVVEIPELGRGRLVAAGVLVASVTLLLCRLAWWRARATLAVHTPPADLTVRRDDDRFWVGGLIYVNRDDPAIFVPKRLGLGWTLNFGNRRARLAGVLILAMLIAAPVARIFLLNR